MLLQLLLVEGGAPHQRKDQGTQEEEHSGRKYTRVEAVVRRFGLNTGGISFLVAKAQA